MNDRLSKRALEVATILMFTLRPLLELLREERYLRPKQALCNSDIGPVLLQ